MTSERATVVTLTLTMDEAEHLSSGVADLLCWCRGYMAGISENTSNAPIGVEETRTLRIKLKQAMNAATPTTGIF